MRLRLPLSRRLIVVSAIALALLVFRFCLGKWFSRRDSVVLKSCIQRQPSGPRSVDSVMIRGADHMYSGEEEQVARTIATWADNRVLPGGRTEGAGGKR